MMIVDLVLRVDVGVEIVFEVLGSILYGFKMFLGFRRVLNFFISVI